MAKSIVSPGVSNTSLLFCCQLATLGLLRQTPSYSWWATEIEAYPTFSLWLARVVSVVVLIAAIIVILKGMSPLHHRTLLTCSGIMLVVGAAITLYAASSLPLYLLSQICIGIGHAWILVCWADYLSRLESPTRNRCITLSALMAVILFALVELTPWVAQAPLFLIITVGSIAPLLAPRIAVLSYQTTTKIDSQKLFPTGTLAHLPAELIILMASYALLFRMLVFFDFPVYNKDLYFIFSSLLRIGGMVLLLVYMARKHFKPSARQIVFPLLFLTVIGVTLLPASSELMSSLSLAIVKSSWTFFYTIMWLVLFELGKERGRGSLLAFLSGWTTLNTLLLIAAPVASFFKTQVSEGVLSLAALALVIIYMLSVGMLLLRKKPLTLPEAEKEPTHPKGWKAEQEAYFHTIAELYGLTKRETDVFELLVLGYSLPAIEEKFVLSHSTVKGHARNIYRKFNVAGKQELIELVNRLRKEGDITLVGEQPIHSSL